MIPWAANSTACWPDPHLRSMVTDGTWTGKPAESHACRPGVAGLLTGLADAADHDVLDGARVDPGAFDEGGEDLSEQVGRVQPGQGTARFAASHGGADGVDDDCAGHGRPPGRSPINDHG